MFYYVFMRSTSVNIVSTNWGRPLHFDKNGTCWGELQFYYCIVLTSHLYMMLICISKNEKQAAFPIKTFYNIGQNYELKPLTIKRFKLSQNRVGRQYIIQTPGLQLFVFVCSEFCLTLMQDFFLPKTSFFQSQFVYLSRYLYYIPKHRKL